MASPAEKQCKDNNFHCIFFLIQKIIIFASIKYNNTDGTSQSCKGR